MDQLELLATVAVFISVSLAIGYFTAKRKYKAPKNTIVVERITYDYLQERDEMLTLLQESQQGKPTKSPVMYAVKDYSWTN